MSRVAMILAILLALLTASAAALIVLPAPAQALAFLAVLMGEKSVSTAVASVLGATLALLAMRPGTRAVTLGAVVVCLASLIVSLVPPAQALRLAGEKRVDLDFGRYLRSSVDTQGPIQAKKTVTYNSVDGKDLGLDVYAPHPRPTEPSAAIVVLHGGGWSLGEKGDASLESQRLADAGFTVFDVQYRTAPQPNWKAATGDVKCAIGWVKQNPSNADWNIDPRRITLLGRSAGGHLALLAAYTPGDARLAPSCAAPDTSVESVVAYYAPTDLAWGYAHPANLHVYDSSAKLRGFIGGPPETTGDLYALLSPTERVTPTSPRTLLVHGGRDQFIGRQHVDMLADRLHAAGVNHDTLIIPYAQHGFDFIFGGLSGQIAEATLIRFLEAAPPPRQTPAPDDPLAGVNDGGGAQVPVDDSADGGTHAAGEAATPADAAASPNATARAEAETEAAPAPTPGEPPAAGTPKTSKTSTMIPKVHKARSGAHGDTRLHRAKPARKHLKSQGNARTRRKAPKR